MIDYAFSGRLNNRYGKKGNNDSVDKKEDIKETNGTIVNRYSGLVSFHCLENSQIVSFIFNIVQYELTS